MRVVTFLIGVLTITSMPALALAKPEFPDRVQEASKSPCVPQCNLCHQSVTGGGEANQPFAESLLSVGGEIEEEDDIGPAIAAMSQQKLDSDGDGVGDIDELAQGQDPNYGGDGELCLPKAGCGARVSAHEPDSSWDTSLVIGSVLALGFWLRARRKRAR